MKKTVAAIAAGLATALVLVGCGSNPASSQGDEKVTAETTAELTYSTWDDNQRAFINKNIAEFNKTYPNIKITMSATPYKQYWSKLKTQADGDNLPDVFWMNGPNIQFYGGNNQLADLSNLPGVDWNNFPKALTELYSVGGKNYGVPKDFDTIALWYNKKIFAEAGVAEPTDNWTWEDFNAAALQISTKLKAKGIYGVVGDLSGGQETFYPTIAQAGGYVIKDGKSGYDQPATIEGLEFWSKLIANGSMPSLQVMTDTSPNKLFAAGKAAMIWAGTWNTAVYAKDYPNPADLNLVQLPKGKQAATTIHGLAHVVSAKSKNLAAAKAFVAYLGSKQAADIEAAEGTTLPAFIGAQDQLLKTYPNWNLKAYTESAKTTAVPYPVSKNTNAWAGLEAELLGPGFSGKEPMAEAAKQMATKMNELLAKEPK